MASPTVRRGLSERYGSWNTICTRRRSARNSPREIDAKSVLPITMRPRDGSIRRAMQRATVDFPEPDSPTIPSVSPCLISSVTSSAAATACLRLNQPRAA